MSAPASSGRRPGTVARATVTDLDLGDLVGPVEPIDWWPDGSALLLLQLVEGRHRLHRYDLATGTIAALDTDVGSITAAAVRPDGEVWYRVHHGEHPARILATGTSAPLLEPDGPRAPAGRDFETWWFENPDGERVHGFIVRPEGEGPYPVILRVHGGPHFADTDRWAPDLQAHVDAGFLVAMVNYRGSVGLRTGVARRAQGQRRVPRARGRARGPRRPRGPRPRGPDTRRARRLVVGRVRDAARDRPAPGPVLLGDRRRAGRGLRRRRTRTRARSSRRWTAT